MAYELMLVAGVAASAGIYRDVEWVRVICDVEQLSNVGLLRIASVLYAQGDMLGHHEI